MLGFTDKSLRPVRLSGTIIGRKNRSEASDIGASEGVSITTQNLVIKVKAIG